MKLLTVVAVVVIAVASSVAAEFARPSFDLPEITTDVETLKWPTPGAQDLEVRTWNGTTKGWHFTAHAAILTDASKFSIEVREGGCLNHTFVSKTARMFGCRYATNAGFFGYPVGGCIGDVVINGTTVQTGAKTAGFGTTKDHTTVVGFVADADLGKFQFEQFVNGVGWIVRGGSENIDHSPDLHPTGSFVTEKAPRTGLGVCNNGTIVLLQVDGAEALKTGVDLFEFADIFISMGVADALNLDGGGSSVSVYNGHVISRPSCDDSGRVCERDVTTITCVA